jgi:hypothetical protein
VKIDRRVLEDLDTVVMESATKFDAEFSRCFDSPGDALEGAYESGTRLRIT